MTTMNLGTLVLIDSPFALLIASVGAALSRHPSLLLVSRALRER